MASLKSTVVSIKPLDEQTPERFVAFLPNGELYVPDMGYVENRVRYFGNDAHGEPLFAFPVEDVSVMPVSVLNIRSIEDALKAQHDITHAFADFETRLHPPGSIPGIKLDDDMSGKAYL